ncbi:MAG: Bug family tripartite tricarboxylate transporter substrate binding protein [Betaproteobacteria bacterium]
MKRRQFSAAVAAAVAAPLVLPGLARAQAAPAIKMMIPANPGGGWDSTGRALAAALQAAKVVSNVQFDNKGGAAGTIGLAQFINAAKGDPHALMMGGMVMVGGIILNKSPVGLDQVTPIARLTTENLVVVVPAKSPHKTVGDLMNAFKANPGAVSWGGGSAGGSDHILIGLMARATGGDPTKVNYVAFKGGGEAVAAIIGGHGAAGVSGLSEFSEHIKSGRMRALAVSGDAREEGVPTLREQGINVVLGNWRGVFGAPGITPAQRDALVNMVRAATETPAWKDSLQKNGWQAWFLPGDQYKAFIDEDSKRVGGILESLGLVKT